MQGLPDPRVFRKRTLAPEVLTILICKTRAAGQADFQTFEKLGRQTAHRPLPPLAQIDTGGWCRFVTGHWLRI